MYVTYEDHETGINIFDDLGTDRTPIKGETVIVNDDVYKVKKVIHNFQINKI